MFNEFVVILGKKGQGKTHYLKNYVAQKPRVFYYDPKRQFSDRGIIINNTADLLQYIRQRSRSSFSIVYQPDFGLQDRDVIREEFREVSKIISIMKNIYFVIDEIHTCIEKNSEKNYYLNNIINAGRHSEISLVMTTIRYTQVDRDITAQSDKIVLFRTQEISDIKYFRERIGELAEQLPTLHPFYHIIYEDGEASVCKPI